MRKYYRYKDLIGKPSSFGWKFEFFSVYNNNLVSEYLNDNYGYLSSKLTFGSKPFPVGKFWYNESSEGNTLYLKLYVEQPIYYK